MKKTYRVPVEYLMRGYQTVDANSYEEAVGLMVDRAPLLKCPTHASPVEGSMRVQMQDKVGKDPAILADAHEAAGLNVLPRDTAVNRSMFTDTISKL